MAKWLDKYNDGGPVQENYNDAQASTGPGFVGTGYDTTGRNYSPAWGGQFAMGGGLPGATGMMYARTVNPAPSNGPYAKKTKASAQNGKEMKFYQEGLDFKPKNISQDGAIVDPMGQWAHPGEVTIIPGSDITMKNVPFPVLGVSDKGDVQMMYPEENYKFDGESVTEYPMAQNGDWLSKYATEPMRQDATRNVVPRKMTTQEKKEAKASGESARKKTAEKTKEIVSERTKNRQTKGDLNTPGSWHTEDKARLFPSSVGGVGEIFDDYVNPATYVGVLSDALGESVAARDPKAIATSLALAAGTGALGIDPLGSAIKGAKAAGKYLTEETALKNAYKLNPYAFKPDPEAYYRTLGKEGIDDAFNSGVIRPKQSHSQYSPEVGKRINVNTPEFPEGSYFNKSGIYSSDKLYNPNYIAEVKGKDELFTYPERIVFNENIRVAPKDIPIEQANFYKKDWLKGYKEVPKKEKGGWLNKYK